jgi:BirA family biotin operon repressor/biotin-[acetyl-CoA-carboxylase] ligase
MVGDRDPAIAASLGFVAGLALDEALRRVAPSLAVRIALDGVEPGGGAADRLRLKWPNDVLLDGAKLAGILLEAQKRPDGRLAIVIGFGVNIVSAPSGLPYPATSLNTLGSDITAETIFSALAEEWVVAYELWDHGNNVADILRLWRASAAGIGAEVAVNQDGAVVRGVFESIDDTGRLIVRSNDNSRIAISAGDVHFGVTASVRA